MPTTTGSSTTPRWQAFEGQDVEFQVVVTNTSNATETITSLTDAWPGHAASDIACDEGDPDGVPLVPGASFICTFTQTGYAPAGGSSLTDAVVVAVSSNAGGAGAEDTSTVDTPETPLGIHIVKSGESVAHVGETVHYTFDV